MRKVLVELHFDRRIPEIICETIDEVIVGLGPNLGYEEIRETLGDQLSEEEWLEIKVIWSSDDEANRFFRRLPSGAMLIHR